jgi:hypothetical protein
MYIRKNEHVQIYKKGQNHPKYIRFRTPTVRDGTDLHNYEDADISINDLLSVIYKKWHAD